MKLLNLSILLTLTLLFFGNALAQEDFGLDTEDEIIVPEMSSSNNEEFAEDEIFNSKSKVAANDEQTTVEVDTVSNDTQLENQEIEPASVENLSILIKQLNLSDKQLDALKFLSDESRMRQEQLEKSIELFKNQAREIEEQNLREFEEVLTSEQREIFEKIRAIKNAKTE